MKSKRNLILWVGRDRTSIGRIEDRESGGGAFHGRGLVTSVLVKWPLLSLFGSFKDDARPICAFFEMGVSYEKNKGIGPLIKSNCHSYLLSFDGVFQIAGPHADGEITLIRPTDLTEV